MTSIDGGRGVEGRSRWSCVQASTCILEATAVTRKTWSLGCKLNRRTTRIVVVDIVAFASTCDFKKRETSPLLLSRGQLLFSYFGILPDSRETLWLLWHVSIHSVCMNIEHIRSCRDCWGASYKPCSVSRKYHIWDYVPCHSAYPWKLWHDEGWSCQASSTNSRVSRCQSHHHNEGVLVRHHRL